MAPAGTGLSEPQALIPLDKDSKPSTMGRMSPDKQQAIFDKYPKIFRDRTKPMTETCMCWGLEVPESWLPIVDALCAAIQQPFSGSCSTAADGSDEGWSYEFPQVVADQVKSKFASLRFYYHLEPDVAFLEKAKRFPKTAEAIYSRCAGYVDGAIGLAEVLCEQTCEETGAPGKPMVRGGWWKVVSPEVAVKEGFVEPKQS